MNTLFFFTNVKQYLYANLINGELSNDVKALDGEKVCDLKPI